MPTIEQFREKNCKGCKYVNELMRRTGAACCSYPGYVNVQEGKCLTRVKEVSHANH